MQDPKVKPGGSAESGKANMAAAKNENEGEEAAMHSEGDDDEEDDPINVEDNAERSHQETGFRENNPSGQTSAEPLSEAKGMNSLVVSCLNMQYM